MSIYPDELDKSKIRRTWQLAAIDIKVPETLSQDEEDELWAYLSYSSPAKVISFFADAFDAYFELEPENSDYESLSIEEKEKLYDRWRVVQVCTDAAFRRFSMPLPPDIRENFVTDIEEALYCVNELLQSIDAPSAPEWEQRLNQERSIDNKKAREMMDEVEKYRRSASRQQGAVAPSPE